MRNLKERLLYFPFEYQAFGPHLEQMAKQGWRIKKIKGNWLWSTLIYERCTPQTLYYYMDFSVHSQYYVNPQEEDKDPYYAFVEEYGYHYICNLKGIVIYESDKVMDIELRDSSMETHKELAKATRTSLVNFIWLCCFEMVILWSGFHINIENISSYQGLLKLASCGLVILSFLFMLYPFARWFVHPKKQYPMRAIQCRTTLLFAILFFWICSYLTNQLSLFLFFYVIANSVLVLERCKFQIDKQTLVQKITICVCTLLLWIGTYTLFSTTLSSIDKTLGVYVPPLAKEDVYIQSDSYVQLQSQKTFLCTYISAQYDEDGFYSYTYVEDTIFKDYLLRKLPYEQDVKKVTTRKAYTIYERIFDVVVVKGQILFEIDKNLYEKLDENQIDDIFKQLEEVHQ